MSNKIEMNMLRERAKKMPEVTDEIWQQVDAEYRSLVEEYISVNSFSPQTKKQYISGLKQFGHFMQRSMNNKPFHKLTKRDFLRYLSYLRDDRRMSSSGINFKKACISSLCNYIENVVASDDDTYRNFSNFTRGLPSIPKNKVYSKELVTHDEYKLMMDTLEEDENYLGMAWLATAFLVGARRSELTQFRTEILDYEIPKDKKYVLSHVVRGKGKSEDGKPLEFMIPLEVLDYWKKWVEVRGYEHDHIFTTKYAGKVDVISKSWANYFCSDVLSNIVGRRINVHIFKNSAITHHLNNGTPIEIVSKFIGHHESVETTSIYDLRDFEEERDNIFK